MIEKKHIDAIRIESVVLLDTDKAGSLYMERLFPLWVDPIVFTIEGKYPLNNELRDRTITELSQNKNIRCILFGAQSEKYKTATDRKLSMAPFFIQDLTSYFWQKPMFEFYDQRIIELMKEFCEKVDIDRIGSYESILNYNKRSTVKWYHSLII
jgi:hypothetical protein